MSSSADELYKRVKAFCEDLKNCKTTYPLKKGEETLGEQLVKEGRAYYSLDRMHLGVYHDVHQSSDGFPDQVSPRKSKTTKKSKKL